MAVGRSNGFAIGVHQITHIRSQRIFEMIQGGIGFCQVLRIRPGQGRLKRLHAGQGFYGFDVFRKEGG